jgi:hypothetical protein
MRFCKGDASLLTSLVQLQVLSSTDGVGFGWHSKLGYHGVVVIVALSSLTDWTDPLQVSTFIFANKRNKKTMHARDFECSLFTQKRVVRHVVGNRSHAAQGSHASVRTRWTTAEREVRDGMEFSADPFWRLIRGCALHATQHHPRGSDLPDDRRHLKHSVL